MKKEFPPRIKFDDGRPIDWDDVCECGHRWADHPLVSYGLARDLLSIFGFKSCFQPCNKCQCPQYKLDKDNPSERRLSKSTKSEIGKP